MLAGLGPNTVLARMVSIRTEEDEEMLKHFTPEQRRIRCEWRNRTAAKVSIRQNNRDKAVKGMVKVAGA